MLTCLTGVFSFRTQWEYLLLHGLWHKFHVSSKARRHEDTERHGHYICNFDGGPGFASSDAHSSPLREAALSFLPCPTSPPNDWDPDQDHPELTDETPPDSTPRVASLSIHGSALPSDLSGQIFNDWGGYLVQFYSIFLRGLYMYYVRELTMC